jgi:hypothetical protein
MRTNKGGEQNRDESKSERGINLRKEPIREEHQSEMRSNRIGENNLSER